MTRKKYPFEHAKAMYSKWFWQLQNPNLFLGIKTKQSILLQIYLDIYLRYFNAAALFFSWWLMFHCCCIVPLLMIDVSLQLHRSSPEYLCFSSAVLFFSSPDDWCLIAPAFFSWWLIFHCSCIVPRLIIYVSLLLHCSSPHDWCFIAAALFFSWWLTFRCSLPEDFFFAFAF